MRMWVLVMVPAWSSAALQVKVAFPTSTGRMNRVTPDSRTGIPSVRRGGLTPNQAWETYLGALEAEPLLTKSLTAMGIIGAGDAAAQAIEGQELDIGRVARWALFGLVLQAPWNHFFYQFLDGVLPPTLDPWTTTTAVKVGIDQFVQAPIFTAVIFVFFALVEGRGLAAARQQLNTELGQVLLKNWAVFLPATIINLAFCPPVLRVLFLNCVFFFWVIFLSLTVNKTETS